MNLRPVLPLAAMLLGSCAGKSAALREERERVLAEEKRAAEEIAEIEAAKRELLAEQSRVRKEASDAEAEVRSLQANVADLRRAAEVYRAAQRDLQALQDEEDSLLQLLDEIRGSRSDPEEFRARAERLRAEAIWNLLSVLAQTAPLREFVAAAGVRSTPALEMALESLDSLREEPALLHPRPSRTELKEFARAAETASAWLYTAGQEIVFDDGVSKALDALSDAVEVQGNLARFLVGELGSENAGDETEEDSATEAEEVSIEVHVDSSSAEPEERPEPKLDDIWTTKPVVSPLALLWWGKAPASRDRSGPEAATREVDRMLAALRLLAEIEEVRRADWDPEAHVQRRLTNIRIARERIRASLEALGDPGSDAGS